MPKGALLAEGRTAEIYAWEEGQVLKLYRPGWDKDDAEYEHRKALASQETDFAVPRVYGVVEVDGRAGIVYQRMEGITMLQAMQRWVWAFGVYARQLAKLQAEMHTRSPKGLESNRQRLRAKIERGVGLEESSKRVLIERLEALPEGDKLLHGDFHPDNVMLAAEGAIIIDWIDATCGHPLADVARTVLLSTMSYLPPDLPGRPLILLVRSLFNRVYLREYFKRSPYERDELKAWMLPVMGGRLSENIEGEVAPMVARIRKALAKG